jgi:hypothetical protein
MQHCMELDSALRYTAHRVCRDGQACTVVVDLKESHKVSEGGTKGCHSDPTYLSCNVLQKTLHDLVLHDARELAKYLLVVLRVVSQHAIELVQKQFLAICEMRREGGFDVGDQSHRQLQRLRCKS